MVEIRQAMPIMQCILKGPERPSGWEYVLPSYRQGHDLVVASPSLESSLVSSVNAAVLPNGPKRSDGYLHSKSETASINVDAEERWRRDLELQAI